MRERAKISSVNLVPIQDGRHDVTSRDRLTKFGTFAHDRGIGIRQHGSENLWIIPCDVKNIMYNYMYSAKVYVQCKSLCTMQKSMYNASLCTMQKSMYNANIYVQCKSLCTVEKSMWVQKPMYRANVYV
jgi:hypothetical protein